MTDADIARMDQEIYAQKPISKARLLVWLQKLRDGLAEAQSGKRQVERILQTLKNLVDQTENSGAAAIGLLREYKMLPLEKPPEPPVEKKREEFMEVYRGVGETGRKRLEAAAEKGGDAVLLGMIEIEKAKK